MPMTKHFSATLAVLALFAVVPALTAQTKGFVPGKTPDGSLAYWNREIVKVLNDPQVKTELAKHGLDPAPGTREELADYMARESEKWGKVVREAKITAE